MHIKKGFFTVPTKSNEMEVYYSYPSSAQNSPTIIIFQEAFGINEHIKDVCLRFALEGYTVLAPELFHRLGKHIQIDYHDKVQVMDILKGMSENEIADDFEFLLKYFSHIPQANSEKLATIGFCIGGYSSLLSACRSRLKTAVSFYGAGTMKARPGIGLGPIKEEFKNISCPVLLMFGGKDTSIPLEEVKAIEEELGIHRKEFKSIVFENSNHGFFCDQRPSYNPESAKKAWSITLEWLNLYL